MPLNPRLFKDFIEFSQAQYNSLDYDPFHPMLWQLQRHVDDEEAALWNSVLYMAFYNVGSSYLAFQRVPKWRRYGQAPTWVFGLPVGVQRRNLRGGLVAHHLEDYVRQARAAGSLYGLLTQGFTGEPRTDWGRLQQTLLGVWGNGRWAAYTSGELFQKVNKLPVLPCDIMNDGSSGPRAGLARLYACDTSNTPENLVVLDQLADHLFAKARAKVTTAIPYLPLNHYDHGMLESQLCDFNSLCKGRYYIGRDIDRDQERIVKAEAAAKVLSGRKVDVSAVWETRERSFARRFLGEFNGWAGRTEYAKTYYLKTGIIADHFTIRENLRAGSLF